MSMDTSLDDYGPSIQSKIEALRSGLVTNNAEVESISREAKKLLGQYEREVERCARFTQLYPELPIPQHRRTRERLVEALHSAVLEARAAIGRRVASPSALSTSPLATGAGGLSRRPPSADPAASLAQEITDTLRSMSATLQEEVLRAETSYDIMQRSSKRMQTTSEMYRSFGGLLGVTKRLIAGLWRRERSDRWMILAALALFYSVLFYVAVRRLWLGKFLMPTLRLLFSTTSAMFQGLLSMLFLGRKPVPTTVPDTAPTASILPPSLVRSDLANSHEQELKTNIGAITVDHEGLTTSNMASDLADEMARGQHHEEL